MTGWGLPVDAAAWLALCSGLACVAVAWARHLSPSRFDYLDIHRIPRRWYLAAVTALSAAASLGYVWWYLRGGPRIIDATSYLLQAKIFASGRLAFEPPGPPASFHGRFLYATHDGLLTPLFPPGYPLLLAAFVWLGVPLLSGPVLAAAVTGLTYVCGRLLFGATQSMTGERIARTAALMCALCAVLRYHTADTMSHGLSAALLLGAVCMSLLTSRHSSERGRQYAALVGGLLLGWLFATRPVTGLVGACTFALFSGYRPKSWLLASASMAVGVFAFLWHQTRLTGQFGLLVQPAYYATADGPPGCVRLGLGPDIGCQFEHGDFIAQYMPDGYGPLEALGTTGRRLAMHVGDAGNSGLFFFVLLLAAWTGRHHRSIRRLAAVVVLQVVAYAAFYFDGNFPGGGARMFAEVIPFELLLAAWYFVQLRQAALAAPMMLLGFALRGAQDHRQLAEREGGRPMYEPPTTDARLLFVQTDHGFNLGFEPERTDDLPLVARSRGDAHDRVLWEALGRPPAALYHFDLTAEREPWLEPFVPVDQLRFEGESFWPARRVEGGWSEPQWSSEPCTSAARRLMLHPSPGASFELEASAWVLRAGSYRVHVGGGQGLNVSLAGVPSMIVGAEPCEHAPGQLMRLPAGELSITVKAETPTYLDYLELVPVATTTRSVEGRSDAEAARTDAN